MATVYIIPTTNTSAWYTETVAIQGVRYTFTFRWNDREQLWFMTIGDSANNDIVAGVPLHWGRNLLSQYAGLPLPRGVFVVRDKTQQGVDPGLTSFGLTHALYFMTDD